MLDGRPIRRGPLRVVYVINSFDTGGAESGLVQMVRGGVFVGCELSVVALVRGTGGVETQLQKAGCEPQILLDRPSMKATDLPVLFMRLRRLVMRESPDVLIASLPQANLLSRLCVILQRRTVFVSFEHNTHLAKRVYELGYRLTSKRVDWVLADAQSTLDTALQRLYRAVPPRQTVVPLVCFSTRPDVFKPGARPSFHVVNAARFTPVKNQAALIEAVAALDADVMLTLYGDGLMREHCMLLAQRLGIAERVRFPGFVSDWSRHPADLFVLTSGHEGLCIVVLEAMNAGIPVAAPLIGGLRDYAVPNLVRAMEATTAPVITAAIKDSMENRETDAAMADRAMQMVERRFGVAAVHAIYGEVNRALMEIGRSGALEPGRDMSAA